MELFFRFFLCHDVSVSTDYVRSAEKSLFYLDTKMGRYEYFRRWARTMNFKSKAVKLTSEPSLSGDYTKFYISTWNEVKGM